MATTARPRSRSATVHGTRSRTGRSAAIQAAFVRIQGRQISASVQYLLWGRAAGRCQFDNCNRDLTRVPATQETRNLAEKAHIYAFSPGGPRASDDWPKALINDIDNLLLVCRLCHKAIDGGDGPQRYTAALLQDMKRRHESRVLVATSVRPDLASHVVTYGVHVGHHQALPALPSAASALFPRRYPAPGEIIELGRRAGSQRDHDDAFWVEQGRELRYEFGRQVRTPLERGDITHLSVFAIAPQPLLVQLGVLMGDITGADVYQLHREPKGWAWPEPRPSAPELVVERPARSTGLPALVLGISGPVAPERIVRVLGDDAAIWSVSVPEPHNDVAKTPELVTAFGRTVRQLLEAIRIAHGDTTPLHIFPVLPVALAVELGRIRMPKADAPWVLYDENTQRGGFLRAFTITPEDSRA